MSTMTEPTVHPILGFGRRLHEELDVLASTAAWAMTADEQRDALVELARGEARMAELRLRVLAAGDRNDIAAAAAASSTAAWVAQRVRQSRSAAQADVRLALPLDTSHPATREALSQGLLDLAQARVVVAAVDHLPESVAAHDRERAERHLVSLAAEHDAGALKALGRRVFEVLDPAAADAEEGRRLEAEERSAARATHLHLFDNGDGTHTGRFKISTLHAAMLTKMLHAMSSPRRAVRSGAAPPSTATRPELRGQAFCGLLERFPSAKLPRLGGVSATVLVLLDYERLLSGIGAARLDTGERISAGQARRLACEAGIIPAVYRKVLGGPSHVLDVGRRRRFHDPAQRIAMTVRDRGCTADGCGRPAAWCQAHHDKISWSHGGGTSVDGGRLLCPFHHGKAHSPAYDMTRLPDGTVRFHRRT
jgi:Domain of unknown function (DUF222)